MNIESNIENFTLYIEFDMPYNLSMNDKIFRQLYNRQYVKRDQIILPSDEYASVMSEFNSHLTEEERKQRVITKPIGNYVYTVINNGFNDYIVIGKNLIDETYGREWEDD